MIREGLKLGKPGTQKWENLAGCFFAEPPELPELGEVARLPGGRTSSSKKEDSAEVFFPQSTR